MSQSIAFQYHRNPDAVCVTQRISWDWIMGILFSFIFVCSEMINLTSLSATTFVSRSAFIEYKTWIRACVWACFWLLNSLPNANYSLLSFAELLWRAEQVRYSVRPLWTEMGICLRALPAYAMQAAPQKWIGKGSPSQHSAFHHWQREESK